MPMPTTVGRNTNSSCALSRVPKSVTYMARFTTLAGARLDTARKASPAPITGSTRPSESGQ